MKYIVIIIFLFSPVRIQPQSALEQAKNIAIVKEINLQQLREEIERAKQLQKSMIMQKQNYINILQQETTKSDDLKRKFFKLKRNYDTCDDELKQCEDRIQNNMAIYYQQEIEATEKRIQEVLREKNDKIPLSLKQKEEKEAVLNQLNDEKSKLNKLKNEKERLLREIENCQTVPKSSTVLVPESSTSSASTCFLSNLIDYKGSLIHNLLSALLGLARNKS